MVPEDKPRELGDEEWPDALRHEVRRIQRWPAVDAASLSIGTDELNRLRISFSIQTERLLDAHSAHIRNVEPVTLIYRSTDAVGLSAPSVWSARPDFPRDIGHINATSPDHPASLCLAPAGLQLIYDRFGVDGVMDRLSDWLYDAKTGQLMQEGWEPVPVGEGQEARAGYFDIGFFQELALEQGGGAGRSCGVARLLTEESRGGVVILRPALDLTDAATLQAARKQVLYKPKEEGVAAYIPWIFVWSDRTQPIDRQLFAVWNSLGEMEVGLKDTGIEDVLPVGVMSALHSLTDLEAPGGRPVALLIGVWRPRPISERVFGMAHDAEARRLEIQAYLLHCEKHRDNPIDPAVETQQLVGIQLPSREMLAFSSGVSVGAPVTVLGYGALGSCIAEFLLRLGIPNIAAIDNDELAPHNLARHHATAQDLYARKVTHLGKLADAVTFFDGEIERVLVHSDIVKLTDEELSNIAGEFGLIVDTTAEERVRRRLARAALQPETKLVRAEIFDRGRLGALFVTGPGNRPHLIDLYYALCARAVEDEAVENWLRAEQATGTSSEELVLGMGCASATTRLPKYTVAHHASAFMPIVMAAVNENVKAGTGVNPLGQDGTPLGWRWYDYGGDVTVLEAAEAPGWQVRLSAHATNKLADLRVANGEVETGGYLYGGYDFVLKQIYVAMVSDVPPGTTQSAAAIDLGPAGRTRLERKISRRAGGKLARVGTWHSHPQSGPAMSARDRRTMERFRGQDRGNGVPTLLVISSPEGNGAHLWT